MSHMKYDKHIYHTGTLIKEMIGSDSWLRKQSGGIAQWGGHSSGAENMHCMHKFPVVFSQYGWKRPSSETLEDQETSELENGWYNSA